MKWSKHVPHNRLSVTRDDVALKLKAQVLAKERERKFVTMQSGTTEDDGVIRRTRRMTMLQRRQLALRWSLRIRMPKLNVLSF